MQDLLISQLEVEELRANVYQRRAFPLPDLSVVTAWFDGQGALRLTITPKPVTLPIEVTAVEGVGP